MSDFLHSPWPWYIVGPLIGLMVPALMLFDNKHFGISSTLRDFCSFVKPGKLEYFNYDVRKQLWRNVLVVGVFLGGVLAAHTTPGDYAIGISENTINDLQALGLTNLNGFVPAEIFNWGNIFSLQGLIFIISGGFLIGFGSRWADGCTAGHAITGLSLLSPASLLSVIGFFIGGLVATHFLLPLILN